MVNSKQPTPEDQRMWQRYEAITTTFNQPEPLGYKGESVREYQREMGRKILAHGTDKVVATAEQRFHQDKDIAMRMMASGHTPEQVARAISKASPEAARQPTREEQRSYGQQIVAETLRQRPAREFIGSMNRWKMENNIPKDELRLDKIGDLATKYQRSYHRER
jgi:hypothetical protein